MGKINREPDTKELFDAIYTRLTNLENKRFQIPQVSADPTNYQKGDIWVNTTTNLLKFVDKNGTIRLITFS